ncbi:aspartate aminotransferase family protein [Lentzea sp. NBRC 105346]|uniref:aminotransferase family protein n=1 Tax=Lentzea sp. NBRC 105346 TaxID=3032205 RepID=UPI0024A51F9E|nr:aspartate aminotransferase family protein [Lentzea sp. NBRC 105346]GLZ35241.1 aspartate aminotransferase family protein [Lentzea sp. NBRC 105346]
MTALLSSLVERDRATLMHPLLPEDRTDRTVLVSGNGVRVRDADGRSYLDASAVLGLMQVGHGRTELAEAAAAQMRSLACFHTWGTITNDKAVELATRLVSLAPDGLDRVFFTSGGAEGNEIALRMARFFHHRQGHTDRTWLLSRHSAYHGIGYGSGSVSGSPVYQAGFGPVVPDVALLTPPHPYQRELFGGDDPTDFCVRELEKTIDQLGAHRIAAMIGEPVMGGYGAVVPPADYWPRIAEVLRRNGILLIFDEVVTAFGRTGRWFGAEHFGVVPDILVTAKGITSGYVPHGAVLVSSPVADVISSGNGFPIGYTYTGHPTACAVALANLDIIERERLLDNAVEVGAHLGAGLRTLLDLPAVGDVRQLGMMLAVQLVSDKDVRTDLPPGSTLRVADALREDAGIIVRTNPHSLIVAPPLILDQATADELVVGLRSVLSRLGTDGVVR